MPDFSDQPDGIHVPIVWVGVEELPVAFANQFIVQVDRGEVFLTIGQFVPPPIIGATEEERRAQAENIEFVQVKPVARVVMTPSRLYELATALEMGKTIHNAQEERFGDPRKDA